MAPRKKAEATPAPAAAGATTRRSTRRKDASDQVAEILPEETAPKTRNAKKMTSATTSTGKRGRAKLVEPEQDPEQVEIDSAPAAVEAPKTRQTRRKKKQEQDEDVQAPAELEDSVDKSPEEQQPVETKTRGRSRRQKKPEPVDDHEVEKSEAVSEPVNKDTNLAVEEEKIPEKVEPRGRGRRTKKAQASNAQLPEPDIEPVSAPGVSVAAEDVMEKTETKTEDGNSTEVVLVSKRRGRVGRRQKRDESEEVPALVQEAVEQPHKEITEAELPVVGPPTPQPTKKATKSKQTRGRRKQTKEEDTAQLPETLEEQQKDEALLEQAAEQKEIVEEVVVPPAKLIGRSKNKRRGAMPFQETGAAVAVEPANDTPTVEVNDEAKGEVGAEEVVKPKVGRPRRQPAISRRSGRRKEEAVVETIVEAKVETKVETTESLDTPIVEQEVEDDNESSDVVQTPRAQKTKQPSKTRRSRRNATDQELADGTQSSEVPAVDAEETSCKVEEVTRTPEKTSRTRRGRNAKKIAQPVDRTRSDHSPQAESSDTQAERLLEAGEPVLSIENAAADEEQAESVQVVVEPEPTDLDSTVSHPLEAESAEPEAPQQKNKRGRKRGATTKSAPLANRSTSRAKVDVESDHAKKGSTTPKVAKTSPIEQNEESQAALSGGEDDKKEEADVSNGELFTGNVSEEQSALQTTAENSSAATTTGYTMAIEALELSTNPSEKSSLKKRPSSAMETEREQDDSTPRKRSKTKDQKSPMNKSVLKKADWGPREVSLVSSGAQKRVFEPEVRRISSRKSLAYNTPTKNRKTKNNSCPQTAPRRIVYTNKVVIDKALTSPTIETTVGDNEPKVEDEQVITTNCDERPTLKDARESPEKEVDTVRRSSGKSPVDLQSPSVDSGMSGVKQPLLRSNRSVSRKSFPFLIPTKNLSHSYRGVPQSAPRQSIKSTFTKHDGTKLSPTSQGNSEISQSREGTGILTGDESNSLDREPTEDEIVTNVSSASNIDEENTDSEFHCAADRTLPFAQEQAGNNSINDHTGVDASVVDQEVAPSNDSPHGNQSFPVSPVQCATPSPKESFIPCIESTTKTPIATPTPQEAEHHGPGEKTLASENLEHSDVDELNEQEDSTFLRDQDQRSPHQIQQSTPQNPTPLSRPFCGPLATSTPLVNALKQHPHINNRLIEGDDISNSMMEGDWEGESSIATVDYGDSTIIDDDIEADNKEDILEQRHIGMKFQFPKRLESTRTCQSPEVVECSGTLRSSQPKTFQPQELNSDLELSLFGPGPPEINENGIEDSEISELHEWEVGQVDDEMETNEPITTAPLQGITRDLPRGSRTPQPKSKRDSRKSRPSLPARLSGYHQKLLRSNGKPQGSPLKQCQTITENGNSSPLQAASAVLAHPGSRLGAESPTPSIKRTPNKTPLKRLWQETSDESMISELNDAEVEWLNKGIELGTPLATGTPQAVGTPRAVGTPSKALHTPKNIRTPGALGTPRRRGTPSALGTPRRLATPRSRVTTAGSPKVPIASDSSTTPLLKANSAKVITPNQLDVSQFTNSPCTPATPICHPTPQKSPITGVTLESGPATPEVGRVLKYNLESTEGADTLISSPGISCLFRTPQKALTQNTEALGSEPMSSPISQTNVTPEHYRTESPISQYELGSEPSDQEDFSILSATGPLRTVMSQLQPEIPTSNRKSPRKVNFHTNMPAVRHSINILQAPPTDTGPRSEDIGKKGARRNTLSGELKSGNTIHPDPERTRLSYLGSPPVVTEQDVLVEQDVISAEEAENERLEKQETNDAQEGKERAVLETTPLIVQEVVSEQADLHPDAVKVGNDLAQDEFLNEFVARYAAKKAAKAEEQTSAGDSDSPPQDLSTAATARVIAPIKQSPSQKMKKANVADIESPIRRSPRASSIADSKPQSPIPDNSKAGQTPKMKSRSHKASSLPVLSSKGRQSKSKTSKSQPSALSAPPPRLDLSVFASSASGEAPSLSQLAPRELAKITAKNTTVNALWENVTFEREVIQRDVPRPPSPNGKRQTIQANDMRRKRKAIEEETGVILGPGDELDFIPQIVTPSRKRVKWNGPLELGREEELPRTSPKVVYEIPRKSVLKQSRMGTAPESENNQLVSKVKVVRYLYLGEKDEYS